jgi:hypothetical protein
MSYYEIFKKRLKIGNVIQIIHAALVITLICLSFAFHSLYLIAFIFMVTFIILQPILLVTILVANISTIKNNTNVLLQGYNEIIVFKIRNRSAKDFFQFVGGYNLKDNTVYTMSRKTGFSNLINYSLPMEEKIHVNFVYSKSLKDLKKDFNCNDYNIAMLDLEDNLTDDLINDGLNGIIFQKNSDIILICNVCHIEKNSPKLSKIYKIAGSFYSKTFMIPLYGNILFLYKFICQYNYYKEL